MNLLPKSSDEFRSADYWEKFFKRRGEKAFEWYGEYPDLCSILHKYIKTSEKILVIGCGNSNLSADMYDIGYQNIVNIDISSTVIRSMSQKNADKRPLMKFLQMDATDMSFDDSHFGVVLDKGTLDALMTDCSAEVSELVDKMFGEIARVLRVGGRYVCVSLAQEHIVKKVLHYFPEQGWPVRICRVEKDTGEAADPEREFQMPVFVYVLTKLKKLPGMQPILEVACFEDKVSRCDTAEAVMASVEEMQHYAMVRQRLSAGKQLDDNVSVQLYAADSDSPRYTLFIVDSPKLLPNKFAIFIVPEGRETEWLFASPEGRSELLKSCGFQRLVVVALSRDHKYENLDVIKKELSGKVMELAPGKLNVQVPFLTIGDDINTRSIQHRGSSDLSGDFVVEDIESEGEIFRRLIFLNNKTFVQSEARMMKVSSKSGKRKKRSNAGKMVVDPNYLSMGYQSPLISGLALVENASELASKPLELVLVGLGGGSLSLFIQKHFPKVKQEVVELDPSMVQVAKNWFGLTESESLEIHVADGLEFIRNLAQQGIQKDVIVIDVDCKDGGVGMTAPPEAFVDPDFLRIVDTVLRGSGVFILNLACRNQNLRSAVISNLKSVFGQVFQKKVSGDVNECIYCFPKKRKTELCPESSLGHLSERVQKAAAASIRESCLSADSLDIARELEGLQIL